MLKQKQQIHRLSQEIRLEKFFYAEAEAGMYDGTVELVVPQYRLMHETMIDLLKYHFRIYPRRRPWRVGPEEIHGTILDIGSGSGAESIRVMKEFPNIRIVAVDLCSPMHDRFRENYKAAFSSNIALDERCTLVEGDILNDSGSPENLLSHLPPEERDEGYIAVITAFTLHHLSTDEKPEAFRRIYDMLEPGGVMINGDLLDYCSPELKKYARDFDNHWIESQFEHPDPRFTEAQSIPEEKRRELSTLWLTHYEKDNLLDPVEGTEWIDPSLVEEPSLGQAKMLRDIGFRQVGCPFRYWQVGILWAKK